MLSFLLSGFIGLILVTIIVYWIAYIFDPKFRAMEKRKKEESQKRLQEYRADQLRRKAEREATRNERGQT